jgi:hypothetical protein
MKKVATLTRRFSLPLSWCSSNTSFIYVALATPIEVLRLIHEGYHGIMSVTPQYTLSAGTYLSRKD